MRALMPFRQTIAAKIFGLAIILLLLTIGLAGFLLWEVTRTKQDLKVVAHLDLPLTEAVARLDEFGLRRRLAFERWFGALNEDNPDQEIVAEASSNHSLFTGKLKEEFAAVRRIIDAYPKNVSGRETLAEVKTLLDQIEPAYTIISARQSEALNLQLGHQHEKANQEVDLLDDLQRTVQSQRESMSLKMAGWERGRRAGNRTTRTARILVNDCRDSVDGIAGSRRGGAHYEPAYPTRAVIGQRHARCAARQPQCAIAGEFGRRGRNAD